MNQRILCITAVAAIAVCLIDCQRGGETGAEPSSEATPPESSMAREATPAQPAPTASQSTPPPGTSPPVSPPPPATPAAGLSVLTLHSARAGSFPYEATVYPNEGLVPAGQMVVSPDDATLRSSALSRWPDGSASVVVLAGQATVVANGARTIHLERAASTITPLTAARVGQLVTNVTIDMGSLGTATLTDFSKPQKIWWSNDQVVCARYRVPVGSQATLEAIIDVHAFAANYAKVEVVVENGKLDIATPTLPASPTYSAAVSVNSEAVTTVSTTTSAAGTHEPFRAWYASHWVSDDPGVEVTHDAQSIQAHPLFSRIWKTGGSMSAYASDAYVPWGVGRLPAMNMGAAGDAPQIGPLSLWETQYLQTGDVDARRAVVASALSVLTFNVNYRDAATGLVPTFDALAGKNQQNNLPVTSSEPSWEVAHHPAVGLMAFLAQPSPVFIELAQKVAVWNGTWSSDDGTFGYWYQVRGRAWALRSLAHAVFLTPDDEPWKTSARVALQKNVTMIKAFKDDPKAKLGLVWDYDPAEPRDFASDPGFQMPVWQDQYLLVELHKMSNAGLLTGASQADLKDLADWTATEPVRYVNESIGGEWRYHYYETTVGTDSATIASLPTWGQQFAWQYTAGPPPADSGMWYVGGSTDTSYSTADPRLTASAYYEAYFWAALVAAVERGVDGADTAWARVTTNVTNISTWSDGFAADPRWGSYPRNK